MTQQQTDLRTVIWVFALLALLALLAFPAALLGHFDGSPVLLEQWTSEATARAAGT